MTSLLPFKFSNFSQKMLYLIKYENFDTKKSQTDKQILENDNINKYGII